MEKASKKLSASRIRARFQSKFHSKAHNARTQAESEVPRQKQDERSHKALPSVPEPIETTGDYVDASIDNSGTATHYEVEAASGYPARESWAAFLARIEQDPILSAAPEPHRNDELLERYVPQPDTTDDSAVELDASQSDKALRRITRRAFKALWRATAAANKVGTRTLLNRLQTAQLETWSEFLLRVQRPASVSYRSDVGELESRVRTLEEIYARTCQSASGQGNTPNLSEPAELDPNDPFDLEYLHPQPTKFAQNRPCTEPPILDYSNFEKIIAAQKEINVKKGGQDIAWRTDIMDNFIEQRLMGQYNQYAWDSSAYATATGSFQDAKYFQALRQELRIDADELRAEKRAIVQSYGKSEVDAHQLQTEILQEARRNDPDFDDELLGWYYRQSGRLWAEKASVFP